METKQTTLFPEYEIEDLERSLTERIITLEKENNELKTIIKEMVILSKIMKEKGEKIC